MTFNTRCTHIQEFEIFPWDGVRNGAARRRREKQTFLIQQFFFTTSSILLCSDPGHSEICSSKGSPLSLAHFEPSCLVHHFFALLTHYVFASPIPTLFSGIGPSSLPTRSGLGLCERPLSFDRRSHRCVPQSAPGRTFSYVCLSSFSPILYISRTIVPAGRPATIDQPSSGSHPTHRRSVIQLSSRYSNQTWIREGPRVRVPNSGEHGH